MNAKQRMKINRVHVMIDSLENKRRFQLVTPQMRDLSEQIRKKRILRFAPLLTLSRTWWNIFRQETRALEFRESQPQTPALLSPDPRTDFFDTFCIVDQGTNDLTMGGGRSILDVVKYILELTEGYTTPMKEKSSDILFGRLIRIQFF